MTKEEIQLRYEELCNIPSDINTHLPILRKYADECEHITEMGVRGVISTYSFLSSKAKKVVAIDIFDVWVPDIEKLIFVCADDLEIDIEETDMLFIDTKHCYNQLIQELNLHSPNVRKYIAMHDVSEDLFGINGDDGGKGTLFAIEEFLEKNNNWKKIYHVEYNNGLIILEKI